MPNPQRIRVEAVGSARVVRFVDRQLFDDRTVREATDQVQDLVHELRPRDALVLDFSGVMTVSSAMVGKLVLLMRRVEAAGASLRLCELNETISAVLRTTNLDRLFAIDRDVRGALAASGQGSK